MLNNLDRSDVFSLTVVGLAVLALFIVFALSFARSQGRSGSDSVARAVGLALPAEPGALERRVTTRLRAGTLGGALGGIIALVVLLVFVPHSSGDMVTSSMLFSAASILTGGALAIAVVAMTRKLPRPEGARFARAQAVTLPDYSMTFERVGARVVVALAVALTVAIALGATSWGVPSGIPSIMVILMTALGAATLLAFELAARHIVARPQPAGSPEELAWDDAMRAWDVRDLVTAPIVFGTWALVLALIELSLAPSELGVPESVRLIASVIALLVAAALVGLAIHSFRVKPRQHYLRRLWPEIASRAGGTP